jgi:phytoene dehydrogenase-like protein
MNFIVSAQAAYLAKAGKSVAVLERRHVLGGAAVTEEVIPGFKFSRASYLISLLRPKIVKDLELKVHVPLTVILLPSVYKHSSTHGCMIISQSTCTTLERD